MRVVSNSSPLIVLLKLNKLQILKLKFNKIFVPKKVYEEVIVKDEDVKKMKDEFKWIKVKDVRDEIAVNLLSLFLDRGESEAIILAKEMKADLLLMDDKKGRRIAEQIGLNIKGVVSLLVEDAKKEELAEIFKNLEDVGFRLSIKLKDKIMESKKKLLKI